MKNKDEMQAKNLDKGLDKHIEPTSEGLGKGKTDSDINIEVQTTDINQEKIKELKKERDLLKKASETTLTKIRYLLADYDNYRKQIERLTDDRISEKRVHILSSLLEIYDDFRNAVGQLENSDCPTAVVGGFKGVLKNLESSLKSEGVQKIESLGKMFDPDIHDPAGFQENNTYPEKTVVEVKRNGYMLDNKLLRPSLVILSKKVSSCSRQ